MSAPATANKPNGDVLYDADVNTELIEGSGSANGGFTLVRKNRVAIGIRAKSRFPADGLNLLCSNFGGTKLKAFDVYRR